MRRASVLTRFGAFALASMLAACGGGGSSSAPQVPSQPNGTNVPLTPNGTISVRGANGATFTATLGASVPPGEVANVAPGPPPGFTVPLSANAQPFGVVKDMFAVSVSPAAFDIASFAQYSVTLPGAATPPPVTFPTPVTIVPASLTVTIYDASVNPPAYVWVVGASALTCYVDPPGTGTVMSPNSPSPAPCTTANPAAHLLLPGHVYAFVISA